MQEEEASILSGCLETLSSACPPGHSAQGAVWAQEKDFLVCPQRASSRPFLEVATRWALEEAAEVRRGGGQIRKRTWGASRHTWNTVCKWHSGDLTSTFWQNDGLKNALIHQSSFELCCDGQWKSFLYRSSAKESLSAFCPHNNPARLTESGRFPLQASCPPSD